MVALEDEYRVHTYKLLKGPALAVLILRDAMSRFSSSSPELSQARTLSFRVKAPWHEEPLERTRLHTMKQSNHALTCVTVCPARLEHGSSGAPNAKPWPQLQREDLRGV